MMTDNSELVETVLQALLPTYSSSIGPNEIELIRDEVAVVVDILLPIVREQEKTKADLAITMWEMQAAKTNARVDEQYKKWIKWSKIHACCKAGFEAAPDPCPWHYVTEE
jgi:hypothetical protein